MQLAIDAHNLRQGGGMTHLRHVLQGSALSRFQRIRVYGRPQLREEIFHTCDADIQWTVDRVLDQNLLHRLYWHNQTLPAYLGTHQPDVLFSPGGLLPLRLPSGIRTVTMFRNLEPFSESGVFPSQSIGRRLRIRLQRRALLNSFRRTHGLIFLSNYARNIIARMLPLESKETATIAHGVDERFCNVNPLEIEPDAGKIHLLYVSSLMPYKHHPQVLQAISILSREMPLQLTLAGWAEPSAVKKLKKQCDRQGVRHLVKWLGYVNHEKMPDLYRKHHIFIFASSCENCPNILLEAMATGIPIVCSDSPPMAEFAQDSVTYFNPHNPASLVKAIRRLIDDKRETQKLALQARRRAQHYCWQSAVSKTVDFLLHVGKQTNGQANAHHVDQ